MGFGCCSIHSGVQGSERYQGSVGWLGGEGSEGWGLGAGGWGLGGEGCGPCEEEAPASNGKRIIKPDHAAASSALLFRLPTEGGQRYPWRRQVGQGLSPSSSPSPSPSPFLRHYFLNFSCPEVNSLSFRVAGRATNQIAGNPDQLWRLRRGPKLSQYLWGPAGLNFPGSASNTAYLLAL